jgi:hypothetical protein
MILFVRLQRFRMRYGNRHFDSVKTYYFKPIAEGPHQTQ